MQHGSYLGGTAVWREYFWPRLDWGNEGKLIFRLNQFEKAMFSTVQNVPGFAQIARVERSKVKQVARRMRLQIKCVHCDGSIPVVVQSSR